MSRVRALRRKIIRCIIIFTQCHLSVRCLGNLPPLWIFLADNVHNGQIKFFWRCAWAASLFPLHFVNQHNTTRRKCRVLCVRRLPRQPTLNANFLLLFNQCPATHTILYHLLRIYPSAINNPELNKWNCYVCSGGKEKCGREANSRSVISGSGDQWLWPYQNFTRPDPRCGALVRQHSAQLPACAKLLLFCAGQTAREGGCD